MKSILGLVALLCLTQTGCKNKDYERCLEQVDAYEKGKLECSKLNDKAQQDACMNKNEVRKISRENCNESYK